MAASVTITNVSAVSINFIALRGDTFYKRIEVLKNGVLEDFTGSTFKMQIRNGLSVVLELTNLQYLIISTGEIEIKIPASVMETLALGTFRYDLQQTLVDGTVRTRFPGSFQIVEDITRQTI